MTATNHTVPALADRLTTLAEAYKEDVAAVIEDAKEADVDTSAVRRLSSWQRKDPLKRAEQEAIDHQYRFLAGEVDEPATLPAESLISQAMRLYADKLTVRQVAEVLEVSVGKAQKLKTLANAFAGSVHVQMNVNTDHREMTADDLGSFAIGNPDAAREMTEGDLGDPLLITNPFRAKVRAAAASVKRSPTVAEEYARAAQACNAITEDDLAIPAFLDRRRQVTA
jgi:uncharacterized protein (UPF0335 family)